MKMFKVVCVIAVICMLCVTTPASAEIPAKVAVAYNCDANSAEDAVGVAVKPDFIIDGVDIDVLITSQPGEMFQNDEQGLALGGSYNKNIIGNLSIFAGAGIGTPSIEEALSSIDDSIEINKYVYAGLKLKI